MSWDALFASATVVGILAALGAVFRDALAGWFASGLQHAYDKKLESLRHELQVANTKLAAELDARKSQLERFSQLALSSRNIRKEELERRKILAIENLWKAVMAHGRAEFAVRQMEVIKFEAVLEASEGDPKVRELFGKLGAKLDDLGPTYQLSAPEQLFVPELVWAIYSAYSAVIYRVLLQFEMIRAGLNKPDFLGSKEILKLVKTALPHFTKFIDEHGVDGLPFLAGTLKEALLKEMRKALVGHESDKEEIELANEIMSHVSKVNLQTHHTSEVELPK